MRKICSALLLSTVSLVYPAAVLAAETPQEILDCAAANSPEKTFSQEAEFVTSDQEGSERELKLRLLGERGDDGLKLNLRVLGPPPMAGTAILIRERDGQDDMRIFLPATGRTQAVTGSMAASKLLGTDFSYLDIKQMFGAMLDGEAAMMEPAEIAGRQVRRLKIQPIPEEGAPFSEMLVAFDQQTCVALQVLFMSGPETELRRLEADVASLRSEGKHHYAGKYSLIDHGSQTRTDVSFGEVQYDQKLHRAAFHPINFTQAD